MMEIFLAVNIVSPEDGSTRLTKVFFTMDHKMVIRKFVEVILSHYWTEDKRVSGLTVNLDAPDPFPDSAHHMW